ncbi:MAG TPA: pectate lyase [Allosphingosinicella sp.]|jgi:hypothetical protein
MMLTLLAALAVQAPAATAPPAGRLPLQIPAFPGAEGAGRFAAGGRGGRVIRVTNLDDAGPGSLRAAIEADGPRTIVFDVGGNIRLRSPLVIRKGQVTLAGQTAPGGGITLRDQRLEVAASDVVVRYIRTRLGDESGVESDAFTVSRGARIIVDHVSASWSVDETLSVGSAYRSEREDLRDVTVQWSIISESLRRGGHAKGEHGYGSLLRGARGARISMHHNLWAHHAARMPRPGNYLSAADDPEGAFYDFRSNVFYNWGGNHAGYNADNERQSNVRYNFVSNAYVRGPDSTRPIAFDERNPVARAWFEGNSMDGTVPADPWSLVRLAEGVDAATYRLAVPVDMPPVTTDAACCAFDRVLAGAGHSLRRDPVDARVVASVRAREGRLIDSQREVGGWPELEAGTAWVDSDGDGMPDAWERANRLDPRDASDGARDTDGDGYTQLENWLDALTRAPAAR